MFKLRTLSGYLAFDAAARHSSLTSAAKELGRTQSAVSQQVKALEAEIGLDLFVRRPREVSLTPTGRALAKTVSDALTEIEETITELGRKDEPHVLRLTTYQSFAIQWLIPRLPRFSLLHPEIDVRINADDQRRDLRAEGYDLAVRVGKLPPGVEALHRERMTPMYAPAIAHGAPILGADLGRVPLLAHAHANFWSRWLAQNNIDIDSADIGTDYSHSGLLVQAAAAGGGVALAPLAIASDAILAGRLACVPGTPVDTDHYYYVQTAGDHAPEKVQLFKAWIEREMALMEKDLAESLSDA